MSVVMISSTSSLIMSVVMIFSRAPTLARVGIREANCVVAKVNQPALSLGTERWLIHSRFHCSVKRCHWPHSRDLGTGSDKLQSTGAAPRAPARAACAFPAPLITGTLSPPKVTTSSSAKKVPASDASSCKRYPTPCALNSARNSDPHVVSPAAARERRAGKRRQRVKGHGPAHNAPIAFRQQSHT